MVKRRKETIALPQRSMIQKKGGSYRTQLDGAKPLTDQELVFIEEYMVDYDARDAAVRSGVPSNLAARRATVWLRDPRIRDLLDTKIENRLKATGYTSERIVEELYRISFSNIFDFLEVIDNQIFLKNSKKIPKELGSVIKSIEKTKMGLKVTLWNKLEAAALLMKMHGMLVDKVQVDVTLTARGILDKIDSISPDQIEKQLDDFMDADVVEDE